VANNAKYIAALGGEGGDAALRGGDGAALGEGGDAALGGGLREGGGALESGTAWEGGDRALGTEGSGAAFLASDGSGFIAGKEELTVVQQLNEYIMISLRTMEGSSLSTVARRFGVQQAEELWRKAERYMREGKIKSSPETLALTQEGKLLADGISADLFFD
jgi:hypothetical protein